MLERRRASDEGITVSDWQRWVQLKRILDRQFQSEIHDTTSDRREDSVRVPTRLRVGFESYGEIRESLMTNVSRGGLFITTRDPLPLGTKIRGQIRIEEPGEVLDVQ